MTCPAAIVCPSWTYGWVSMATGDDCAGVVDVDPLERSIPKALDPGDASRWDVVGDGSDRGRGGTGRGRAEGAGGEQQGRGDDQG